MSRLLLVCLFLSLTPNWAYETYESTQVESLGGIRVVRVEKAMYLTLTINTPSTAMSDFRFMTEYCYEQLSRYNFAGNYDGIVVPQTTPMFVHLDVLDMSSSRSVSFLIPKDFRENPPAPRYPLRLQEGGEKYFFVRPTNETEFWKIMHAAADLLTDLSYARMPFENTLVYLALYNYPPNPEAEVVKPNEIWVERSLKEEGYLTTQW